MDYSFTPYEQRVWLILLALEIKYLHQLKMRTAVRYALQRLFGTHRAVDGQISTQLHDGSGCIPALA